MGYRIAVHKTRGTAVTTSGEPGMCSQHHQIIQPRIFRVLSQGETTHCLWHAKRGSSTSWTQSSLDPKKEQRYSCALSGTPLDVNSLGTRGLWLCILKPVILLEEGYVSAGQCCAVEQQWANWKWSPKGKFRRCRSQQGTAPSCAPWNMKW